MCEKLNDEWFYMAKKELKKFRKILVAIFLYFFIETNKLLYQTKVIQ